MAKLIDAQVDEQFVDRWYEEGDKVVRHRFDKTRAGILQSNKIVRDNPQLLREMDGMRWALSIPQDDYDMLLKRYPSLASSDRDVKHRAWQRFMSSSVSHPYRIQHQSKGRTA